MVSSIEADQNTVIMKKKGHNQNSLVLICLLLNIANLLDHLLKGGLEVAVLDLKVC